jgi:hypothetical protein
MYLPQFNGYFKSATMPPKEYPKYDIHLLLPTIAIGEAVHLLTSA